MENQMEENNNIDSTQKTTGSVGPMIGSVIVIIIIIVGGFYFWSTNDKLNKKSEMDGQTEMLKIQSDSDEIKDIEADLENTNFDDLDKELDDIDMEFENL